MQTHHETATWFLNLNTHYKNISTKMKALYFFCSELLCRQRFSLCERKCLPFSQIHHFFRCVTSFSFRFAFIDDNLNHGVNGQTYTTNVYASHLAKFKSICYWSGLVFTLIHLTLSRGRILFTQCLYEKKNGKRLCTSYHLRNKFEKVPKISMRTGYEHHFG